MSSCPGYTLEAFLMWNYSIRVEDRAESNVSLGIAEMMGTGTKREVLTEAEFKPLVELFEEHREVIEGRLEDFEEDEMSWRTYAGCAFDFIPDALYEKGQAIVQQLKAAA